jgi:hypothetical protein
MIFILKKNSKFKILFLTFIKLLLAINKQKQFLIDMQYFFQNFLIINTSR